MIIPDYCRVHFEIKEGDDKITIQKKKYWCEWDRMSRQSEADRRINDFYKKYDEIKRMRNRTTLEKLKLQLAIEELLNE